MGVELAGRDEDLLAVTRAVVTHSVVIRGRDGVGKSALLSRVADRLASRSHVTPIHATPVARAIAFGALVTALPDLVEATANPTVLLAHAVRALQERREGRGHVLVVDDAHLLDDSSAAVLDHVARSGGVRLILTHPATVGVSPWLEQLHQPQRDLFKLHELRPLDREAVGAMASLVLDDPCDQAVVDELWTLSAGIPRTVRHLITGARQGGALKKTGGLWCLTAPIRATGQLADELDRRIARFSDEARVALDQLAIGTSLELDLLVDICGADAVEELEMNGVVTVEVREDRATATVVDRLLGDHVRRSMPVSRHRRLSAQLVGTLQTTGARRDDDDLRVAEYSLLGGVLLPSDAAIEAARRALVRGDVDLALRLARHVKPEGNRFEAGLVQGQALIATGAYAEAEVALDDASDEADGDSQVARLAVARCELQARGQGDLSGGLDTIESAFRQVSHPHWREELRAEIARLALFDGRTGDADRLGRAVVDSSQASDRAVMTGLLASVSVQIEAGHFDAAEVLASHALRLDTSVEALREADERFRLAHVEAMIYAGRLVEAEQVARAEIAADTVFRATWQGMLGAILLAAGDIQHCRPQLAAAVAELRVRDPLDRLGRSAARSAQAAAEAGDLASLEASIAALQDVRGSLDFTTGVLTDRARAWAHMIGGNTCQAIEEILATGRRALDRHHFALACVTFHDAVRFGRPETVSDHLHELARDFEGALSPTFARHAQALADRDGGRLDLVSARYEEVGAHLLAAEAACQAAAGHASAGSLAAATDARRVATMMLERCAGAATPALRDRPDRLTRRQEEIARLAIRHRSDDIAELLHLSVRTVESHLDAAYRKLGIHGRHDLATFFGQD